MAIYQKVTGTDPLEPTVTDIWQPAAMAYVKVNDVWVVVDEAYVKNAGVWKRAFLYDVTPPDAPVITTAIIDVYRHGDRVGNYIRVGVRMPEYANVKEIRRIRVLTTYDNKAPTTQYGGTYTGYSDASYPNEPWSEWRYNGYGTGSGHPDTSVIVNKQWPRNASGVDQWLVKDRYYHFAAWAEDFSGNWSVVSRTYVKGPARSSASANVITKSARFMADSSGSILGATGKNFVEGDLVQQQTPRSNGFFFYGAEIRDTIGQSGSIKTIVKAQILLSRANDNGSAVGNVYICWHSHGSISQITTASPELHQTTKLGTIAKGETKWFDLPDSFHDNLSNDIRGFSFRYRDPVKASAFAEDYTVLKSIGTYQRSGELAVTWRENL